ncbi:MAG: glycoside hydrolase family 3 C-terminal domain-containing protein [Propionibacteriaceae bacterium]|jgi:beta-glucosidase|nr:glycoside hydrolase family 3 C-terminal domain-containing protein [Propionibacteriaceae bacterium]
MNTSDRVAALIDQLTIPEKIAQLYGVWLGANEGGVVAPDMDTQADSAPEFADFARDGLSQLTRVFGTKPVLPAKGLATLIGYQQWIRDHTRVPIGILAHEECLTGLAAWTATTYPTPIAWAASFNPELTRAMGAAIGTSMSRVGVHQGLAPVLDVVRDARWGRVEETMGEDPYVIATLGAGYIEGLQSTGIIATAKHFVGYSNSRAGRNLAPVHIGPRELADVFLFPFEVAVRDAKVGSVMPAYVDLDGVPVHGDYQLLTQRLRRQWGFTGTVVSDYFGVAFLLKEHGVAADLADAAAQALLAGMDVELPTGDAFRTPEFAQACADNAALSDALDTAVARVLTQKEALGLLDIDAEISRLEALLADAPATLDPPEHRAIAQELAEQSIILLSNDGVLPLAPRPGAKIAVIGPNADRSSALFGCYSFVNHVLMHNPGVDSKIAAPTILDGLRAEFPEAEINYAQGCPVRPDPEQPGAPEEQRAGFAAALDLAGQADLVIAVMGDQAGLFGKGTSGEGCDVDSLDLPGVQGELLDALLAVGTPLVLLTITGRPYAIGQFTDRAAASIQAFFPGEAGAGAVAGVLSGRINPSGHLPLSVPRSLGVLPYSYLHPKLGDGSGVSSIDTTPQFSFGHGLSYTSFSIEDFVTPATAPTQGFIDVSLRVRNNGDRAGACLIQLYGHDTVACVTRPMRQLIAYTRVELAAGQTKTVELTVPAARFAFHDRAMCQVVEPGAVELWCGWDCDHPATDVVTVELTGKTTVVDPDSTRLVGVRIGS